MKTRQLEDLTRTYGQPTEVAGMASDPSVEVWRYTKARVEAYVEKTTRVVSHMTLFFFEDLDNYVYLKKRFNGHKWIEEALPDDKKSHVVTDRYRVKIPELKMQFEYDNGAPKRKVLWIYFE